MRYSDISVMMVHCSRPCHHLVEVWMHWESALDGWDTWLFVFNGRVRWSTYIRMMTSAVPLKTKGRGSSEESLQGSVRSRRRRTF